MNEKIDQVRSIIVVYGVSNDSAATVPPNELRIFAANEDKKYMGPILCAHMQSGICCNLPTSSVTIARRLHERIGGWGACCIVRAEHLRLWYSHDKRIVFMPLFELDEELNGGRISAMEWMSLGKH